MAIQLINGYVLLAAPADWADGAEILLQWQTGISLAQRGNEDRAGLRALPQAQFAWRVTTDSLQDGAALEDQVRAALRSGQACAPCYPRPSYPAYFDFYNTIVVLEASQWSWAAGDWLVSLAGDGSTASVQIKAVDGNRLTLTAAIPTSRVIWPVVFGRLEVEKPEQEAPDTLSLGCRLFCQQWRLPTATAAPGAYLGTPLAPAALVTDWSDSVQRSFGYDAKVEQIGYGAEVVEAEQSWVQHGVVLSALLRSDSAICDVEAFVGSLGGRRGNFWLPAHERAMLVVGAQTANSYVIQAQGLAQAWNSQPDLYLYFTKAGHAPMCGKIAGVAAGAAGTEQVVLDAGLPEAVDATWDVYRLRLMRLADDELKEAYEADGLATLRLSVIEVPLEYGVVLATPQPAYLYQFMARQDLTVSWNLTSHAQPITHEGNTYIPAAISHAEVKRTMESTDESVKLTTTYTADGPLAAYLPFPPSDRFQVTIIRLDLASAGAPGTIEFTGFISEVKLSGRKLDATVQCPLDFMDRKLPTFFVGFLCNVRLYGPGCNLNAADWQVAAQLAALAGTGVALSADPGKAANYFAGGHLVAGAGLTSERRTIMRSAGISLILNYPLMKAVEGNQVFIYPGCAHTPTDCKGKFANYANYRGHPLVPYQNPTLRAINVSGSGGKK